MKTTLLFNARAITLAIATMASVVSLAKTAPVSETAVQEMKNKSNLLFVENKGQIVNQDGQARKDIQYSITGSGMNIFIGNGQIHYQWSKPLDNELPKKEEVDPNDPSGKLDIIKHIREMKLVTYRLDVSLAGANKNAQVIAEDLQAYTEHYYIGKFKDGLDLRSYGKITYKNVYPNIDWVLYIKDNQLKYDFVVHPGGNVNNIQLKYGGATSLQFNNGAVTAITPFGNITEHAPYCYVAESKETLPSKFVLEGNTLKFDVQKTDGTTVIDPILDWATYYGGSNYDWGNAATADYSGNVYMSGWTYSGNNIATNGAFQDTLVGHNFGGGYQYNGFVVKFNALGQRQWATYYPSGFSAAACDVNSNVYLTGYTDSIPAMATTGAHQTTFGGGTGAGYYWGDAFVVKFNQYGQRMWGTFYGGTGYEGGEGIACDINSNVYVVGGTSSPNNIATTGAHMTTVPTPVYINYYYYQAGFIVKFNTNGVRQWGTYYSGHVSAVDLDQSNGLYIGGTTFDTTRNLIATANAHQVYHFNVLSNNYSYPDGFIAKFNTNGVRSWGTYIGGPSWDWVNGLQSDGGPNIYVSGTTYSSSGYMASSNGFQTSNNGAYDCFLTKFDSAGVQQWGTYYGGSGYEWGGALAWNPTGKLYMSGTTYSTTGMATAGAYQTTPGGSYDEFISEWTPNGNRTWATYYGGSGVEYGWGGYGYGYGYGSGDELAYSLTGKLYLCSATNSTTGIATAGSYQPSLTTSAGNYYDAFLAAFIVDTLVYIKMPYFDTLFCPGDTFRVKYGVTYNFNSGNSFSVQLSNASGSFASPTVIGTKNISTGPDSITCVIPMNIAPGNAYRIRVVGSNPVRISGDDEVNIHIKPRPTVLATDNGPLCAGDTLKLTSTVSPTTGNYSYNWTGPLGFNSTQANPVIANPTVNHSGDYILRATLDGCSSRDTTTVQVKVKPVTPVAGSNSPVCPGTALSLTSSSTTGGVTYSWTGPNSYTSSSQNPTIAPATFNSGGTYYVTASLNGCNSAAAATVVSIQVTTPTPAASSNSPVCTGGTLNLYASTVTGTGVTYQWTGPAAFSSTAQNPVLSGVTGSMAGTYRINAVINGCISYPDSVTVVVNNGPMVNIYPNPKDSVCTGKNITFVAIAQNGGTTPQYQWMKNNAPVLGATSASYVASNLNTGDQFSCILTNNSTCSTPASDTSGSIPVTVLPYLTPSVSITANPTTPLSPYQLITFTATATNAGAEPKYQWRVNGKDVTGATSSTWGTYSINNNDTVSVVVKSSYLCPQPDSAISNVIGVTVLTSVENIGELSKLYLYPNPNTGKFTIAGTSAINSPMTIDVLNAIGQVIYTENTSLHTGTINKQIALPQVANGIYMLRLKAGTDMKLIRFSIDQ